MANVFLCHRSPDKPLVRRLALELESAGHNIWFDELEIGVGDSITQKINEGLEGSNYVVVCFSSADNLSAWMSREWLATLHRQLDGACVKLLPARVSGDGPLPAIVSDLRYANLVKDWQGGLQELLRAIR
jgi:TIR domain